MATKSPADAEATMVANLKESTGHSLEEWLKLLKAHAGEKHGAVVSKLKTEHGVTHGYANLIAHKLLKSDAGSQSADGADLVAAQFAGPKAGLRPVYEAILKVVHGFGEAEVAPKKANVSLRRSKQFALVQPSTATRVDLGLVLKGVEPTARLEASGSWNAMVTHRVRLSSVNDVDAELIGWLKQAYDHA